MNKLKVDYLSCRSETYGTFTLLKLENVSNKELRSNLALLSALLESFGEEFVVVQQKADGTKEFLLSEYVVGIPTPEFERQLASGGWQTKEVNVKDEGPEA